MSMYTSDPESADKGLPAPATSNGKQAYMDSLRKTGKSALRTFTTKEGWIGTGDIDYKYLFTPAIPFTKAKAHAPMFFGLESKMPIVLAALLGLQHALAMMGGIVTTGLLFGSMANLGNTQTTYLVSASLIGSGLLSFFQVYRIKIPYVPYYIGTGMVSVLGVSFATIPVFATALATMYKNGYCEVAADGTELPCPHAYGAFIATSSLCSLLQILFSFTPQKVLLKLFPPIVCGPVVLLIGTDLVKSGMTDWAGGAACASGGNCIFSDDAHAHPWGSGQWIGLGFVVFVVIVICDKWGPPIFKSASIIAGLLVGCIVGAATGYFQHETIDAARSGQFLWVETFRLKLYGPIVLPLLAVYMVCIMESVGDITATSDVSREPVEGPVYERRIQGGVLMAGLASCFGGLMTLNPMASFAQNNGVIAMTQCASRYSGYFACLFLVLMGVIGKFSAAIVAIPKPIIGGMTTFLFTSVAVAGIRIISTIKFTRRDRIVLTVSLMWGFASLLVPEWFDRVITYSGDNTGKKGFVDAIKIVVDTPSAISGFAAVLANLFFPQLEDGADASEFSRQMHDMNGETESIEGIEQTRMDEPEIVKKA